MASQDDVHSKAVNRWLDAGALTTNQKIVLLEKAIRAIETRAGLTLSKITLLVVLDRVHQQVKEELPVLHLVKIEDQSLRFTELKNDPDSAEVARALTALLIELLRVLGRLTADILTETLHKELLTIKLNDSGES